MLPEYTNFEVKKDGNKLMFVASDETKDRHGDIIPIDSWDLKFFKKAPRLLVDHEHRVEKIVGKAQNIKVTKEEGKKPQLVFEAVFHEITELSRIVKTMILDGFLDTVSVGFIPHPPDRTDPENADKGYLEGRNELVEISFVTVPANPNASQIKALLQKEETVEEQKKIEDFLVKQITGEITVKQTEIQTLIFSRAIFKTAQSAKNWAKDHDFMADKVDETANSFRLRQFEPDKCQDGTARTIKLTNGVKAVSCNMMKAVNKSELDKSKNNVTEKPSDTPAALGKKGRSLSKSERITRIQKGALKEAAKIINFALNQSNKLK